MPLKPLKLITEKVHDVKSVIVEAKESGSRAYYIEGIFLQGNRKNQNGRIYPTDTLLKEVNRYRLENIARKRSYGELGHPEQPSINLDRVSHMITELHQDGNDFVGRAKVMVQTPMGIIVKALIDEGAELGVSSRGLGSLREEPGGSIVQEDFRMAAVDIVADPSAPDAFVRGIMEGKEWIWDGGVLKECDLSTIKSQIQAAHAPNVRSDVRKEALAESFTQFINKMESAVTVKVS